jgi:hypothetical protein
MRSSQKMCGENAASEVATAAAARHSAFAWSSCPPARGRRSIAEHIRMVE